MRRPLSGFNPAELVNLDPEQYWQLGAKANAETAYITNTLIREHAKDSGHSDENAAWLEFYSNLKGGYMQAKGLTNGSMIDKARKRELEPDAPSARAITAMLVLFWVAAAFEVVVFVLQGMFGGTFNAIILVYAALLAFGGYLTGSGLGQIVYTRWRVRFADDDRPIGGLEYGKLTLGLVLLVAVAAARAFAAGGGVYGAFAFLITLLLGSTCALFETLHVFLGEKRQALLLWEGQAQTWCAIEHHRANVDDYKRIFSEYFRRSKLPGGSVASALHVDERLFMRPDGSGHSGAPMTPTLPAPGEIPS